MIGMSVSASPWSNGLTQKRDNEWVLFPYVVFLPRNQRLHIMALHFIPLAHCTFNKIIKFMMSKARHRSCELTLPR